MAALRGVWVVAAAQQEVLLARRYPNVEQRCAASDAAPIPRDEELVRQFLRAWTAAPEQELLDRVCVPLGMLWPVVCIERDEFLYLAVPLVTSSTSTDLADHIEVTVALAFLHELAAFTRQLVQEDARELYEKLADLNMYLSFSVPFGQIQDVPLAMTRQLFKQPPLADRNPVVTGGQKQPPWKPTIPRGKSQMHLTFREEISAAQYDSGTTSDTWQVAGTVICRAELDGVPDVTIELQPGPVGTMTAMAVHPCVQAEEFQQTRKLMFSPPTEPFALCHYRLNDVPYLPLRGFYQMKELDAVSVKILVQLKLSDRVHNNFEYCQLAMPFSNRGTIVQLDVSPTSGAVVLSNNRQTLIWNIGQKFTGRSREVALPGTVYFQPAPAPLGAPPASAGAAPSLVLSSPSTVAATFVGGSTVSMPLTSDTSEGSPEALAGTGRAAARTAESTGVNSSTNGAAEDGASSTHTVIRPPRLRGSYDEPDENSDAFCSTKSNAQVQLRFKLIEDNISGCTVDAQSLGLYPMARVKLTAQRELVARNYVIWNSLGEARSAMAPPSALPPL